MFFHNTLIYRNACNENICHQFMASYINCVYANILYNVQFLMQRSLLLYRTYLSLNTNNFKKLPKSADQILDIWVQTLGFY